MWSQVGPRKHHYEIASGGDGILLELFQILKDNAVKVLHSMCQQIWKTQQWPQDWKRSVFIPIPKRGNAKECSNCHTTALISHASKLMIKILQARLQQYVNCELPNVQSGFRKSRWTRYQIANICWIIKKARNFQKNIYFCFIDCAKAFNCMDHNKLWKIRQEMEIPDHLTCLLRNLYACQEAAIRTGHGTTDWFKIRKGVWQGCVLSPCFYNLYAEYFMRNVGWTTSWNQDCWEKYQSPQICRWHHPYGRKQRTKELLDESERGEWKIWVKAQHSENEDHDIWSHYFMANRWGHSGNSGWLHFFWAPKSLQTVTASMKLKDAYSLEGKLWPT